MVIHGHRMELPSAVSSAPWLENPRDLNGNIMAMGSFHLVMFDYRRGNFIAHHAQKPVYTNPGLQSQLRFYPISVIETPSHPVGLALGRSLTQFCHRHATMKIEPTIIKLAVGYEWMYKLVLGY